MTPKVFLFPSLYSSQYINNCLFVLYIYIKGSAGQSSRATLSGNSMRSSLIGSDAGASALRASMTSGPDTPNVTSTLDRCVAVIYKYVINI